MEEGSIPFREGRVDLRSLIMVEDKLGRELKDLRISVTDRCSFRCFFCMPPDKEIDFLKREELLSYEEIAKLVRILTTLGVRKIRITGGEPLIRAHLENLIELIAGVEEIEDVALTTNGYRLSEKAHQLKEAGLRRITVSLLTLKPEKLPAMVGREVDLGRIIEGIDRAKEVGLNPIKINTVVVRGVNDDEIVDIAEFCRERGLILRFIEYMDVGTLNGWSMERVVSAEEMLSRLGRVYRFEEIGRGESETALRYRYSDNGLEFGIIASVTKPFCRGCTRLRLSADGRLFTCLFSDRGFDIKKLLRNGASEEEILSKIRGLWSNREDRYSERRFELMKGSANKVEMFRVGG